MSQQVPEISVGMPVYNGERWVGESIESILAQSFGDFELVVSDNGSTDGTTDICNRYAQEDPRVRFHRQSENLGASENYNFVFRNARAKYFKWASSNDLCHATFLERCHGELSSRPDVALCYPRTRLFAQSPSDGEDYEDNLDMPDESPCVRFEKMFSLMKLNNVMNGLVRSDVLRRTSLIKPYFSSDAVLMAEVALHGKVFEVPDVLFYRRMDAETATHLKGLDEVVKHYSPRANAPMSFQRWRLHLACMAIVFRAPLGIAERACLLRKVLKHARWDRKNLGMEVREALSRFRHQGGAALRGS